MKTTPSDNTLQLLLRGMSIKLAADFEFLSSQLSHSLSKGEAREFVLKELLRQYLPAKLGIDSGLIISSVKNEKPSKQIDIVIYDKLNAPILYSAANIRLFPIECVYAVIEVKSKIGENELLDSIAKIRSVKCMTKKAFFEQQSGIINEVNLYGKQFKHFPVLGLVFAYTSIKGIEKLKKQLKDNDNMEQLTQNIDTICILNKAIITNKKDNALIVTKEPSSERVYVESIDSLLLFYLLMMHVLPQTWMHPIRIKDYAEDINFGVIK